MIFGRRSVQISFPKTPKVKDGDETLETPSTARLEEIQDFVVNTVAGVGVTIVAVTVVRAICTVAENLTKKS